MRAQTNLQLYSKILKFEELHPKSFDVIMSLILTTILLVATILRGYVFTEAIMISLAFGFIFLWIFSASWKSE